MSNIKDVCYKLVSVKWSIASWMSSKLEPVIWLRVLVTLAYMKGRTDVRTYVRTLYVRTYGRSLRHGYKTKFSHIDGLPYFLNYGAPRARAFGARGAPLRKIIDDPTKFKRLENDPTAQREAMLQRFLRKLKTNGHLDDVTYSNIYPTGSEPARIYGLPKMHKTRAPNTLPPFCPIISSIGTYNYKLSKYLCSLLQPHIPSEHCAVDTFTFVREIQSLSMQGKYMVSFDVESLFAKIPLEESIDLAVEYIFKGIPNSKITHDYLKKLFFIATSQKHFLFDGSFYDQIDGVAMGSPLAPVLANLFMGHHEMKWLDTFPSEILFYRRYVDDTFCLFHEESDALLFFDFINSRHPNIRFTMEAESDNKLPFLDIYVDNTGPTVVTRVFRKKTFTGLLTCFFSFTSFSYKTGLVKTLVDRTLKICNTGKRLMRTSRH